jgi:glycosyltransferase involved in cell wall biosynthesis
VVEYLPYELAHVADVYARADEFDLIHNHLGWQAFPFARYATTPTITTAHGRLDLPATRAQHTLFPEQLLVSISNSQRQTLPTAQWAGTVYNGIDLANFHFRPDRGDYLVFLGRISPEKRPDRAIAIARAVGMRLVIAAKVDPVDGDYYESKIAPLIRSCPLVEYIGEVNEREKDALLGGAYAYLFPIDWPEPFGLTMVEAMATGTPVIAWHRGSVREVVVNDVTGYVCSSLDEMIAAVRRVPEIDRASCRAHVEQNFDADCMVKAYERIYKEVIRRAARGIANAVRQNGYGDLAPSDLGLPRDDAA